LIARSIMPCNYAMQLHDYKAGCTEMQLRMCEVPRFFP
jgi:hypothetical protein